ncbi:MAG: Mut7-C RNAse domain-containing protein, partial [Planctomycetota bacterium]
RMLIKLGRYLRCLGYDARWSEVSTREAIRAADREHRVLLTRNTRLGLEMAFPERCMILEDDDPVRQLARVIAELDLDTQSRLFSRCIRCNVELEVAEVSMGDPRIPEGVLERHREFFRCPACATIFWKGSHVANTCRKLGIAPPGLTDPFRPES